MNTLQQAFQLRGLSCRNAAKAGLRYQTVWLHFHGLRNIGVKSVLRYEAILGIPRSELRPDLWPPEHITTSAPTSSRESADADGRDAR